MTASSVTGRGPGDCNKPTTKELSAPKLTILVVGAVPSLEIGDEEEEIFGGQVFLPNPLPGYAEDYAVFLTTVRGGWAQITALNGTPTTFTDFEFETSDESEEVMYMVVKRGVSQ